MKAEPKATKRAVRRRRRSKRRARPVEPEVKRARLFEIAKMMARREYKRGKTDRVLALKYGLALASVQDMTAEASRLVRWSGEEKEQLVLWCKLRLQEIAELAPEHANMAIRTLLANLGELRNKHEVTHSFDPTAGWTDDEVDAFNETGELPARLRKKS